MPGGLKPCSCGACLPCVTWERDAALNRIDRALHVLDTGKHFVPLRVRAILAGEASGKDTVPMVRAEVADGLRARIAELAAGLEATRQERDLERQRAAQAEESRDEWVEVALLGPEDTIPDDAERNMRELLEKRDALERERDTARESALEEAVGAIRQGLAELAKMPTPTKGHEALAELQRNLLEKCVAEIEALKPNPRRGDE